MNDPQNLPSAFAVTLPPTLAKGTWANNLLIHSGLDQIVLDFFTFLPGAQHGEIVARLVLAPVAAKEIAKALRAALEAYERDHGPIPELPQAPQVVFRGPTTSN